MKPQIKTETFSSEEAAEMANDIQSFITLAFMLHDDLFHLVNGYLKHTQARQQFHALHLLLLSINKIAITLEEGLAK